jgi:Fe2+ or Zn2+ uptake regulation protein
MNTDDEHLTTLLRGRGLRVTSQRLLIHRVLREQGGHVSIERVHELVRPQLPGVSQQTVYSTMQLLADLGVARRVLTHTGPCLFEARDDGHHHVVCERCGRLDDIDADVSLEPALAAARAGGFTPKSAALTVLALCEDCRGARV